MKAVRYIWDKIADISDVLEDMRSNPNPKSRLFPYRIYDRETYYFEDGDIEAEGIIFECDPLVGIDESIYKQISYLFDEELPKDGIIEILLLASDNIEDQLNKWSNKRINRSSVLAQLEKDRLEFCQNNSKDTNARFKFRNYRLFFSYSAKKIGDFRGRFETFLESLCLNPRLLEPTKFLALIRELVDYPSQNNKAYDDQIYLSDQITNSSNPFVFEKDGIKNEEYITRCYEVEHFAPFFSIEYFINLLDIPARFAICYAIENKFKSYKQEYFRRKGEIVIKQGILGRFNRTLEEESKEWNHIIQNNLKNRERFLQSSLVIMLTSKIETIERVEQVLNSAWRQNNFILKRLDYFHLPALLSICPFMHQTTLGQKILKAMQITRTCLSSQPKAMLPIQGEFKGNGGIMLKGRCGQLFSWNNFEGGNNYNLCVVGESGSGKSVFLQEFVTTHLALGAKVFVVDIGRSFEKTCKLLGGDFISFGFKSEFSLNPFINITDELAQDSLSYIKTIIAKMAAPKAGTIDIEDATIASSLSEMWELFGNESSIDKLKEILETKGETGQKIATMLFDFTSKGSYGRFFAGNNGIKFTNQFSVLEFEELREQPAFGGVIMQMLAVQIVQQVYLGDRSQKFIILFDEAWYALENFPNFLASMARTVRKYNGALVLGTQSLKNFYGGDSQFDVARMSVMENSAWRVLLRQSGESREALAKMGLSQNLRESVRGLVTAKGEYSECLIYNSDNNFFVARLMLDKFSQVLYSSDPAVFSRVRHYLDSGIETKEAIERVIQELGI